MATARHPKATIFVQRQLFSGLTSFAELEQKIAALPDEQSRGAAFEVFAEAYLATQRKYDAAQVWPLATVPTDMLQKIALPLDDYGVDGVLQTTLGQIDAYQVKFRTNRPALQWNKDKLSNFVGVADSPIIHSRILFTNSDKLPSVMNKRRGFFCIRGTDLDRLEAGDFRAIEAWLVDSVFVAPKKTPQPHQTEALNALLPALQTEPCVSAIMACGTGKTLVALWVTERLEAKRVLVLLPSLALLRQTLHEWLRETRLPTLAYLCVCSDKSVKEGLDALKMEQSDLDFQVTTDTASVRSFLDAPFAGVKMVFSTYQSASVVGAAMKPGEAFDFAVFDEAHKTAGREGRNFAFALEDKNLSIRKRLFMTATPRHYNPLHKDKQGDAQLVFSMDKPDIYGQQAYKLNFAEAARRGIICKYKVIISVITSEMLSNERLNRGEVLVNGDSIHARHVANQIALKDAVAKYGMNKIFTFHYRKETAAAFTSDGSDGIAVHLPDFKTFHVRGTMPTALRERAMQGFRECARGVMSNARCLTEGVDVPTVDMVAFLSPRRSRVDIVQAIGRAMRKPKDSDKTTGYVLVPIYVEQFKDETINAAVARASFEEVWDVLQSLQEQDEVLAEIIRAMAIERGRGGHADTSFGDRVEVIGQNISLVELQRAVVTKCFERLADDWDIRYGELLEYRRLHDDCLVQKSYIKGVQLNSQLATWVGVQRTFYARQWLSAKRIKLLEEIGFVWDLNEAIWQRMVVALKTYKQKHDNCRVPTIYEPDPELAKWAGRQRRAFLEKEPSLTPARIKLLDEIGFEWSLHDYKWQQMFEILKDYWQKNRHCRVPFQYKPNPALARWVTFQRTTYSKQKISPDRIKKLEAIGFEWRIITGREYKRKDLNPESSLRGIVN